MEWPSQLPDLNPLEYLWQKLKIVIHKRKAHWIWAIWNDSAQKNNQKHRLRDTEALLRAREYIDSCQKYVNYISSVVGD